MTLPETLPQLTNPNAHNILIDPSRYKLWELGQVALTSRELELVQRPAPIPQAVITVVEV